VLGHPGCKVHKSVEKTTQWHIKRRRILKISPVTYAASNITAGDLIPVIWAIICA
jgi:hypothetical protein